MSDRIDLGEGVALSMARNAAKPATQKQEQEQEQDETPSWSPIRVTDRKITGPVGGIYTIRLTLSEWPDRDWCRVFAGPPSATDHPTVENRVVLWEVPKSELSDAYSVIKKWIDKANAEYVKILEKRDVQRRQSEDKQAAARAELNALQKELDGFRF
jgi:hypothetical protein